MDWTTVLQLGLALVDLGKSIAAKEGVSSEEFDKRADEIKVQRAADVTALLDRLKG